MRKVPELRFDGFDREWEEKKLSNIVKVNSGRDYKHLSEGKYPVYGTGGLMTYVNEFLSDEDSVGIGRKGTINKPQKLEAPFWTVDTLFYSTPIKDYNLDYIYCIFQRINWLKYDESTGLPSLSKSNINNIRIFNAGIHEQEKIGNLFKKLDDLIEIQEGKVSKMEDFKKSMLQKMFPKKDELVPEFRFDGFDGEWESTKLSYISNRVTRRNLENQSKLPLTISSEFGLVNQLDYYNNRVASKDISNYYLIINGEFAYNKSTSLGAPYGAIKRLDNYENGALSTLYIVFKIVENNLDFIKYYFETSLWHKEIYKVSQEGARNHGLLNIATNDFFSMRIKLPPLAEQEKIGQFFKNLDAQIDTEKKLLDSYKDMKKSLLQKMFV